MTRAAIRLDGEAAMTSTLEDAPAVEKKHVCEICGESFALAMHKGTHKKNVHGIAGQGSHKKKRTGSTAGPVPESSRKTKVKRTLVELADLTDGIRGRGGGELPRELSGVIRRDADQLATVITFAADRVGGVKWFVDTVFVQVLGPALGASGVIRWVLRRLRERAEMEQPPEPFIPPVEDASWRINEPDVDFGNQE